jgi:putative transcriptional regulator
MNAEMASKNALASILVPPSERLTSYIVFRLEFYLTIGTLWVIRFGPPASIAPHLVTVYAKGETADLSPQEKRLWKPRSTRSSGKGARTQEALVMAKKRVRAKAAPRRRLFRDLMDGVRAMREHREGRLTLRTHRVEPIALPTMNPRLVRETREALQMSRQLFAFKLGVNPRTLERWEQGRSKPNEQAATLLWLVRKYPDTLDRLEALSTAARA